MNIDEKIFLSEYNPDWDALFIGEKERIQKLFPESYIEHIGSTAVKGMTAKQIIDIMVSIRSFPPSDDEMENLEKLGYYHFGEHNTTHAKYYFVKRSAINSNIHIGVYESEHWNNLINFRNYLRGNPAIAAEYSKIKRDIFAKGKDTMLSYSHEKMDYISDIVKMINTR